MADSYHAKIVELVGLPGVGKSTVVSQIVVERNARGKPLTYRGDRSSKTPRSVREAIALLHSIPFILQISIIAFKGMSGPYRYRRRRVQKVARGTMRIISAKVHGVDIVLDEGPLVWASASRWKDNDAMHAWLANFLAVYPQGGHTLIGHFYCDDEVRSTRTLTRDKKSKHRQRRSRAYKVQPDVGPLLRKRQEGLILQAADQAGLIVSIHDTSEPKENAVFAVSSFLNGQRDDV